ncbi:carboxymuconolactone decarboxylase family protein [Rhodohalobacter sulfatireducens]|uniref:Peroxidase-related enzyme n=1 Tax=Rhodohalobacter sulfatireducens TaxID=2911366 RepID=A0ABS9KAN3_9BACT|nr:peroxidase-related enzyme [Rhodohalobacter sulfatireducens]MCG2587912.1 peroxidase-related enzyme [Rhodohalobacter sulfatireducens]
MAYIDLKNNLPGIIGLMKYRPETAKPLNELAEILLRGPSTLSSAEREMIASYVSHQNECHFCHSSHGAAAAHHLDGNLDLLDDIKKNFRNTEISPKLRMLLNIAKKVQILGNKVSEKDIEEAKAKGATDREIHDTVLIAAAFCMYNRYVDGLGTWAPEEKDAYNETGKMLAKEGYLDSI